MENKEQNYKGIVLSGFFMLFLNLLLTAGSGYFLFAGINCYNEYLIIAAVLGLICSLFVWAGFLMLEPNEAKVLVFFGKYRGTFRRTGYFWINPFVSQKKLSMRSRNLHVKPIKVNDKSGNPIMIGLVLVWRLRDTYKAMFEIDSQTLALSSGAGANADVGVGVGKRMKAFEGFVKIQSDAALRKVAGEYAYDNNVEACFNQEYGNPDGNHRNNVTLRDGGDEINRKLEEELNNRLAMAGIEVQEARLNYLAYAPEIAAVMLRRQQADAIIAAREKIVEGAVSMVRMAVNKLEDEKVAVFDEKKRAALVSNLLVVLCADEAPQPIINTSENVD